MTDQTEGTPGTDVAPITPTEVMAKGQLAQAVATDVAEFVTGQFMEGAEDPERIALMLTAQILSAETPEEVLASADATGVRQFLDTPFELESVDFQRSEYEQGQPFYVVMKGVNITTGERVVLTTGSRKVTAQAFQLSRRGWLPAKVVAKQATRPTKDGYFPLRLEQATE